MPTNAFTLLANIKDNISPGIKKINENLGNVKKEFSTSGSKLIDLSSASDKLGGSLGKLTGGLVNGSAASNLLSTATAGLTSEMLIAVAAGGALVLAALKIVSVYKKWIDETAAVGDKIDKMSQKMGLSIQAFQEWDRFLQLSGSSIEKLRPGLAALTRNAEAATRGVGEANIAFKNLGIQVKDTNGGLKNTEDLLEETFKALSEVEDQTLRTAYSQRIFGEAGADMAAALNTGIKGLQESREEAKKLGGELSGKTVAASAALKDAYKDMADAMEKIKADLVTDSMWALSQSLEAIVDSGFLQFIDLLAQGIGILGGVITKLLVLPLDLLSVNIAATKTAFDSLVYGVVESVNFIIKKLPERFIPDSWEENIDDLSKKVRVDLTNSFNDLNKTISHITDLTPDKRTTEKTKGVTESLALSVKDLQNAVDKTWLSLLGYESSLVASKIAIAELMGESTSASEVAKLTSDNLINSLYSQTLAIKEAAMAWAKAEYDKAESTIESYDRLKHASNLAEFNERQLEIEKEFQESVSEIQDREADIRSKILENELKKRSDELDKFYSEDLKRRKEQDKKELELSINKIEKEINHVEEQIATLDELEKYKAESSLKVLEASSSREIDAIEKRLEEERNKVQDNSSEMLELYRKQYNLRLAILKEKQELELEEISKYWKEKVERELIGIEEYNEAIDAFNEEKREERIDLEQEYQDKIYKIGEESSEKQKQSYLNMAEQAIDLAGKITNVFAEIHNKRVQEDNDWYRKRKDQINDQYDLERKRIKSSISDEKVKSRTIMALDSEEDAHLAKLEAQKKRRDKENFEREKALSIVLAVINTAGGVVRALEDYQYPASLAIGALVAAAGAIEIAAISSQQFAKGGFPVGKDALVKVNETGQEAILNPTATRNLGVENINALNRGEGLSSSVNNITISPSITINGEATTSTISALDDSLDSFAEKVELVFKTGRVNADISMRGYTY